MRHLICPSTATAVTSAHGLTYVRKRCQQRCDFCQAARRTHHRNWSCQEGPCEEGHRRTTCQRGEETSRQDCQDRQEGGVDQARLRTQTRTESHTSRLPTG